MRALLAVAAAIALVAGGLTTAAVPAEAVTVTTERYAGADRFATSVAVSRATSAGSTVFLASGEKFPDALAAGPVVAAERGHLLLTAREQLPAIVAERIRELRPSEIVVVGSEASVSAGVADAAARVNGARITRIGGADRVETSLRLFDRMARTGAVRAVWVASGFDFPDALVAASVAGRERAAVILDHHGAGGAASQAWLERVRPAVAGRDVRIAGGEPSVSAADATLLRGVASTVTRFAGQDRYTTAQLINDRFAAAPTEPTMLLTTGSDFPDALSGAVHASLRGIPMYLSTRECSSTVAQMLQGEASQRGITRVVGLGGASTISGPALSLGPCARTLQEQIGATFGTFAARSYSGSGDRVIDLGTSVRAAQLRASMPAGPLNQVAGLDADRGVVAMPLSISGAYAGTTLLAADRPERPVRFLQVRSEGAWSLDVRDLTTAPVLSGSASGSGDAVYISDGSARSLAATHPGATYFAVRQLTEAGEKLTPISSCCSGFDGTVPLQAGPSAINVLAESPWTVTLR